MIKAAALKVDITPEDLSNIYVAGFSHNKPATGVHQSIFARMLCLEDESGPLVMVALDLIGLPGSEVDRIRALCPQIPGERIFVASTHTHAGPDTIGLWGKHLFGLPVVNGRNEDAMTRMINAIAAGIRQVVRNPEPVSIGFTDEKSDKTEWIINIQVEGKAYYDNTFTIMKIERPDGTPVACVSNFACHPESLADCNTEISSDFVGFMHETIEQETGALSIFFNGALGAMVTANIDLESGDVNKQRPFTRKMGIHLGSVIARCWSETQVSDIHLFTSSYALFRVPVQNRKFRFLFRTGLLPGDLKRGMLKTSVFSLTIGDAQMASLPGEAAPVTGFAAKQMMAGRYKFLIGLGNDEVGYLLNEDQYNDTEHYGYERTVSIGHKGLQIIMEQFQRIVQIGPQTN
jgi:neutral/alkaline ceramidase-like enzyme